MKYKKSISFVVAVISALPMTAQLVAHFPMDLVSGQIKEEISGEQFPVEGNFAPENVSGAVGQALRFDGYTSHVQTRLGNIFPSGSKQMTISFWVALPCYPIIQIDTETSEKTPIITCLDKNKKTGFGFYLGIDGRYTFNTYIGGWPVEIEATFPLPTNQWNHLVAVIDGDSRTIKLYNNGVEVGSSRANGSLSFAAGAFYLGQGTESRKSGPFELMSFNGLIDDISIWNEAKSLDEIQPAEPEHAPDFSIPASRFADDLLRPRFHGMPEAAWTNESHGMCYADGRYHLFFQKNANGPYMARLHWGHLSSENLYDWKEEPIAIAPGESYDMKGCWSGCVFSDEILTNGRPNILYTAVDYAKAVIAQATPTSNDLNNWTKSPGNPIINGRPNGLSDDFRDPYFFRNGDQAYIIVGSSKNGVGTTTLHTYNALTGMWSNNGDLFFTGASAASDGTFWEMPTITQMSNGKWLFTATPQNTSQGVRTLYWTGSIAENGQFVPDAQSSKPRLVELNSRDGFGLLSPTICQHNGKVIALGIVPDKLSSESNWNLGWAHCYSLPREWSLDKDGSLLQKPFEGLTGLRTDVRFTRRDFELNGTLNLSPVQGRSFEICGTFCVGTSDFGFRLFQNGNSEAVISYSPNSGELIADFSSLTRISNDNNVYNGIYRCPLPEKPEKGSELKLNIFVDHSILDIFVNDKWATSIRVFPTDPEANGVEVFSLLPLNVKELDAWVLDGNTVGTGINVVESDHENNTAGTVDVFTLQGIKVRSNVQRDRAIDDLPHGLYIIGGKKILIK